MLCFRQVFTGNKQSLPGFTRISLTTVKGAGKKKPNVSGYHTGQNSKVPVKHALSYCIVAAKNPAQENVNAVVMECAAQGGWCL